MKHGSHTMAALVAATTMVLTAACGGGGVSVGSQPQPLPERAGEPRSEMIDEDHARIWPTSGAVEEGVAYGMHADTHCGLDHLFDFDGSFWEVTDGPDEPWETLDNPEDEGVVILIAADTAVYESSGGSEFRLRRLDGPREVVLCE
jgi:hypothetical protein